MPDLKARDLTEWEYASLLFDNTCHVCHKPKAKTLDFGLRVRGCAACMRANSLQATKIRIRTHPKVWECVPESVWSPDYYGFGESKTYTFFWLPTVRQVSSRLNELDGKPGFATYVAERKAIKAAAKRDAAMVKHWEARFETDRYVDAKSALKDRQRKIEEKLLELGYTMDDVRGHAVQSHSVYNNESELTDRAWSMAKKKLVTAIEEERAKKREVEAAAAMRSRAEALKPFWTALQASIASGDERMLFPPWANFLHLPAVKQLYEPEDAKPSQEDLLRVRAAVMREAQAFGEEIQAAFYAKLVVAHTEAVTPVTPLDDLAALARLVTSAVPCPSRWCQTWATFPAILDHTKVCRASALTQNSLSTSPKQVRAILHVLGAVNDVEKGKVDAATTSASDLYALGEAFECETCKPKQTAVGPAVWSRAHSTTMGWGAAVTHILGDHGQPTFPTLTFTPPKPPSDSVDNAAEAAAAGGGFVAEAES